MLHAATAQSARRMAPCVRRSRAAAAAAAFLTPGRFPPSGLVAAHDHHRARPRRDPLVERALAQPDFPGSVALGNRRFELERLVLTEYAQRELLPGLIG